MHHLKHIGSILFLVTLTTSSAFAFNDEEKNEINRTIEESLNKSLPNALEAKEDKKDQPGGQYDQDILNKYFGAGIMANFDFGKGGARVNSARTVNGIVRVESTSQAEVGFMLEAHRFISSAPTADSRSVHGPFLGVVLRESNIDTAILGWMWGFRTPKSTQTLNIGIGLSVSPQTQILGDGIVEGYALPAGETEIRYKRVTKYGLAVITSFGF